MDARSNVLLTEFSRVWSLDGDLLKCRSCGRALIASRADEIAKDLGGRVVIVAARILEDADGEQIEPEN